MSAPEYTTGMTYEFLEELLGDVVVAQRVLEGEVELVVVLQKSEFFARVLWKRQIPAIAVDVNFNSIFLQFLCQFVAI